jgi:hypothetical protein
MGITLGYELFIIAPTNTHLYIIVQNFIPPTCFGASAPSSGGLNIVLVKLQLNKLLNLYKAVGRQMVKFVPFVCYNSSNTKHKLSENGAEASKLLCAFVI